MKTDIQIARECELKPISDIASQLGIAPEEIEPYGRYMAKIPVSHIDEERVKQSRLILVTAISPTKAGIGKTTVSIGLTLGLNKIGKKAVVALREPSLGPCFGIKGGAAGGGYAQVLPMEKINLHFTGDFHAVTSAHNTISALLDNYLFQHRKDGFSLREIFWKRVLDVNDRALRNVVTGLRGDGVVSETGFDITPASELMAILCLATSEEDLQRRIENIVLGITADGKLFKVKDLGVAVAITVLLLDALTRCSRLRLFVNTGSFAEYRFGPSSINDAYLYAATKSAFRHFCDYYSQLKGFKYITVVPYTIYGGKPTVKRLMDYIIESIGAATPVDMTAGEQILDFTHVNDLAGFYVHILKNIELFCGLDNGEEFHIGTGKGTSIRELVALVERVFGQPCNINFGGRPYRERDTMHAVAPIAKNLNLAKWRAAISLEQGITMMKE